MNQTLEAVPADRSELLQRFLDIRQQTEKLCSPLKLEDYVVQSMSDVSPTKWHLAHVSWFFETFVLLPHQSDYQVHHPDYHYLFNSYYVSAGERHPRPQRGLLSRPGVAEIFAYRAAVDTAVCSLWMTADDKLAAKLAPLIELGLHHEQQHQELLLMDIKHVLAQNPLAPAYREDLPQLSGDTTPLEWLQFPEGIYKIGTEVDQPGFCYDNETPRHRAFNQDWQLANRPVTNAEFLAFIEDDGYQTASLWLSDGWDRCQQEHWQAPLYWRNRDQEWREFTLGGERPLELAAPVCHVSHYEADAYASWAGARLPNEVEWEVAAEQQAIDGNFVDADLLHPSACRHSDNKTGIQQMFGDVWEYTQSSYAPYPGFKPLDGSLGEYNGKFMANQMVLRGGACVTPQDHIRSSYRNFFYPHMRWQFAGIRLAKDAH